MPSDSLSADALLLSALTERWMWVVLGGGALALVGGARMARLRWSELLPGLRPFSAALTTVVLWRRATEPFNYVTEEWYVADRIVLVLLAAGVLLRPAFVLPFVLVARLLAAPTVQTTFAPGNNIIELPILLLIVVGAVVVVAARMPSFRPSAVVPLLTAAVAAQFWIPGWTKLRSRWLWENELENLPLNGYAQGWRGDGGGELARSLSDLIGLAPWAIGTGALVLELGAIIAVTRKELMRIWLSGFVLFHLATMLALGFAFIEFVVVHIGLLALLGLPAARPSMREVFESRAPAIAVLAVLFGSLVFHPPTLAWFDADVVHRLDFEAVDVDGQRWSLDADDFAPFDDVIAFGALDIDARSVVAGYGAVSRDGFHQLSEVTSLAELESFEATQPVLCDEPAARASIELLTQFLSASHRSPFRPPLRPPPYFWNSRPGPQYDREHPLTSLTVTRVTFLRAGDETLRRDESLVTVEHDGAESHVRWLPGRRC